MYTVVAGPARQVGERSLVPNDFLGLKNRADLLLQFRRQVVRITEVEEILPDHCLGSQAEQVSERLIREKEAPFLIEGESEIGDGGKRRIE